MDNNKGLFNFKKIARLLFIVTLFLLTIFLYFYFMKEMLFHISMKFSIVIIGIVTSIIGYITNRKSNSNVFAKLAPAILFYSNAVYTHTITYPGMHIFNFSDLNFSLQANLIGGLVLSLGMLSAVLDKKGILNSLLRTVLTLIFTVSLTMLAYNGFFPNVIENGSYTLIYTLVEFSIIITFIISLVLLISNNKSKKDTNISLLILSVVLIIFSEFFSLDAYFLDSAFIYVEFLFRFAGIMILFYALIRSNVLEPYNSLFESMLHEKENEKRLRKEITDSYLRLNKSQEIGHIGTWELNLNTYDVIASAEAFKIYGFNYKSDSVIRYERIHEVVVKKDLEIMEKALDDLISKDIPYNVTFSIINKQGDLRHIHSVASLGYDDNNLPERVLGVVQDITKLKEEQNKLLYASYHDDLTGLYNRRYFSEQRIVLSDNKFLPTSIIILDINGLKVINDSFGHHIGNEVLKYLSEVLIDNVPKDGSFVSRIGGDEFSVILPNTSYQNAEVLMNKILLDLEKQKVGNIKLSIAYGICTRSEDSMNLDLTLKIAEDEMYLYKIADTQSMRNKIIDALLNTLYEKDNISEQHSQRVSDYAFNLAKACGLSNKTINDIKMAGLLHDIGKIAISNEILNKEGKLTQREYDIIKTHPKKGYSIIHSIGDMDVIANYVHQHHEFYNGNGYPEGLSKNDISLEARIIAIADAYDAMISYRAYKSNLSIDEAIIELRRYKGEQFDPDLVEIFITNVINK